MPGDILTFIISVFIATIDRSPNRRQAFLALCKTFFFFEMEKRFIKETKA